MKNFIDEIQMYISELLLNAAVTIAPKYGNGIVLSKHALNYCNEVSGNHEDAGISVGGTISVTEIDVVESDEYLDNIYYLVDNGTNVRLPDLGNVPWEGYHYSALRLRKEITKLGNLDCEIISIREFRKRHPNTK